MYKLQHPSKRNKKWHNLSSGLTWFSGSLSALSLCSLCMCKHVPVYEHGSVRTTSSLWRSEDNLGCGTPVYLVWDKVFAKLVSQSFFCSLHPHLLVVRPLGLSDLWGSECRSSRLCDWCTIHFVSSPAIVYLYYIFYQHNWSKTHTKTWNIFNTYLNFWLQRLDFRCLCCLLHFYCSFNVWHK